MMQGNAELSSSSDDSQDVVLSCLTKSSFANCQMDVVRQLEDAAVLITVRCLLLVLMPTQMTNERQIFISYFRCRYPGQIRKV